MNYYKLTFSLEVTHAYQVFKELARKYAANSWSSPDSMFCLIQTPNSIEEVKRQLDVANDPDVSKLDGADRLNLTVEKISPEGQGLPQNARDWLAMKEKTIDDMRAFLDKIDKPT